MGKFDFSTSRIVIAAVCYREPAKVGIVSVERVSFIFHMLQMGLIKKTETDLS